jgi:hypothetical protein
MMDDSRNKLGEYDLAIWIVVLENPPDNYGLLLLQSIIMKVLFVCDR